jgi:Co/Zn/Cd efflux system component
VLARLRHGVRPHSHEAADKVDAALEASSAGMRALWLSLAILGATAVIQAAVTALSGSVALLGDTLHNAADALTAVPLGIAFIAGRRPPTRRYTYGPRTWRGSRSSSLSRRPPRWRRMKR